jgi:hypothetical protein
MAVFTAEDHDFFADRGYVIARNIIPKADCDAVIDAIWEFLGMDRNDPDDWYRLPLKPGGMIEMYQHQAEWNNRQNPRLYEAFTEIRGTHRLCVSIDRVGMKLPYNARHPDYDHKGFTHWDVDTAKLPAPFGVQGVLCLTDTTADMGGFQCIPGFHKNLEEWIATQPPDRNTRMPDLTGLTVVPIPAQAGDLIIWNSLLAHGNGRNLSDRPRYSQYISMFPVERLTEEQREHRIRCWQEHLPPGNEIFPGDPRRIEEEQFTTAELTPLGRKLLGVDCWE